MRALLTFFLLLTPALADTPKVFEGILKPDTPIKAQIGIVLPPQEINKYVAKVETAARKDPEWFTKFSQAAQPGVPLPYDDKLGLTQEEYTAYRTLWSKREFKSSEDVVLLLRKSLGDKWSITSTAGAGAISTLRYDAAKDIFSSPNGVLERIDDIDAGPDSILGAWTGKEWKLEKESALGKIKENFAIGKFTGTGFGVIIYRVQEVDSEGDRLLDKSLVVRFALGEAGYLPAPQKR